MSQHSRFEHSPTVINYAYQLVKEYEKHEREQDKLQREFKRTKPRKVWVPGGMLKDAPKGDD